MVLSDQVTEPLGPVNLVANVWPSLPYTSGFSISRSRNEVAWPGPRVRLPPVLSLPVTVSPLVDASAPPLAPPPLISTWQPTTYPGVILVPLCLPCTSTCALAETQALRCSGVEPIEGLISADSWAIRAVTPSPLGRVWCSSAPGSGTNVSALAAPVENRPTAAAAAAATLAMRTALFFTTDMRFSLSEEIFRSATE